MGRKYLFWTDVDKDDKYFVFIFSKRQHLLFFPDFIVYLDLILDTKDIFYNICLMELAKLNRKGLI